MYSIMLITVNSVGLFSQLRWPCQRHAYQRERVIYAEMSS